MKDKSVSKKQHAVKIRRMLQWSLAPIVFVVIGLGWKYPILGFTVPLVIILAIIFGFLKGRYACGNFCPRGGFFDRIIALISRKKEIPLFLRTMKFRWAIFVLLMGFLSFQISKNPSNWEHWGHAFWFMCTFTTGIGLVFGILIHPRTWCSFCPIGTLQNAVGGSKFQLTIDANACRECKVCEKSCPIGIHLIDYKQSGVISNRDCLKCSECRGVCPKDVLLWPSLNT
jgi:ferredoxin-type protein NapH